MTEWNKEYPLMTEQEFQARKAELTAQEMNNPEQWFYLSYADDGFGGFRGAIFLRANGVATATAKARAMGISPGGQLLCIPYPVTEVLPPERYRNRLLTKADVQELWPNAKSLGELEEEYNALARDMAELRRGVDFDNE